MENVFTKKDPLLDVINQVVLGEKKLTDAELKKREEIAQAIERENPGMDMGKKMAIATAQAKKVAEEAELDESKLSIGNRLAWAHSKSVGTGGPKELVKRHKEYDTDTLKKLKNGSSDGNSPAALQQRVIKHELKKRGVAEEVEQIDEADEREVSDKLKRARDYEKVVNSRHNSRAHTKEIQVGVAKDMLDNAHKAVNKTAVAKFLKTRKGDGKVRTEEVEQIDELSKGTLGKYISKAVVDVHNDAKWAGETDDRDAKNKAFKRLLGVKSAAARLSKQNVSGGRISNFRREEVDLEEQLENFWGAYLTCLDEAKDDASQQALLLRAMAKDPSDLMKMKRAIAMGDKALTNPVMRQEILKMLDQMMNLTVTDKALLQKTRSSFMKQKQFKAVDTTTTEEYVPEEVEELDELSKGTLNKYVRAAADGPTGVVHSKDMASRFSNPYVKDFMNNRAEKRIKDINTAMKKLNKLTKEEVEQLDEAASHEDVIAYADKRLKGWKKTVKHVPTPKRMEDGEPHSSYTYTHPKSRHTVQMHQLHDDKGRTQITLGRTDKTGDLKAHKGGEGIPHSRYPITKSHPNGRAKAHIDAALQHHAHYMDGRRSVKEEVEELDELSKDTLGNYIKKAATGMNGMAVHAHMSGSASSAEQREKHFDKAFKRGKGISKAADKLTKEEVEELDEISKKTLGSYIKKATNDVVNKAVLYSHDAAKVSSKAPPTRTDSDYDKLRAGERRMAKRSKGIDLAVKKLTKEEAEQVDEAAAVSESLSEASTDKTLKVVKHNGKPIGEIGIDSEASPGNGPYYVKLYDGTVDEVGFDTPQEAMKELNYIVKQVVRYSDPAPFEGGRIVKSKKSAAERVKKIAKGMQKKYTKKD